MIAPESEAQQQAVLAQWLPVPRKVWEQLGVSPVARMCEYWGALPCEVRQQWMAWAKCDTYETPGTPTWMGLDEADRGKILKVMAKIRGIYLASDFTHNWNVIARQL